MWSYYGSKSKIVHLYPKPLYPKIIEPFAGTARYSLLHWWKHEVLLIDKYPVIVEIWKWLQQATKEEILALPRLENRGDCVPDNLPQVQQDFLGFLVTGGVESPRRYVASFNGVNVWRDLKRISKEIEKIRSWEIRLDDYRNIPNQEAVWFIDPPYFAGGEAYKVSNKNLDYFKLAEWCKTRKGQVIVCENSKANWLPFRPLKRMKGTIHTTQEVIWSNLPTPYDAEQLSIFDFLKEEEE